MGQALEHRGDGSQSALSAPDPCAPPQPFPRQSTGSQESSFPVGEFGDFFSHNQGQMALEDSV